MMYFSGGALQAEMIMAALIALEKKIGEEPDRSVVSNYVTTVMAGKVYQIEHNKLVMNLLK